MERNGSKAVRSVRLKENCEMRVNDGLNKWPNASHGVSALNHCVVD
jgi:hypothetical protein